MPDAFKAAKVGLFVVVAVAASVIAYRLVEERAGGDKGYQVYAIFDDVQGLVPKSRVMIAGIQVGYIAGIRLEGDRARVDVRVNDDVALFDDADVRKETASLLGESILIIRPGSATRPPVVDGAQIAVASGAPSTNDLMRIVADIAGSVRNTAQQMERVFGTDEGGQQMAAALRNLTEALDAANRTIQQNEEVIGRTLRSVESTTALAGPQIVSILENVDVVTRDVRQIVASNRDGIDQAAGQVAETVASINRAARQLETVLGDIQEVTGRTAEGAGTLGRLSSDSHLVDEMEGVVEGIGDVVGGIARLQTIIGLQSEYNFLANTFKNYVSLRLQPREDRYYLIQLINDPRGLTEFTQTSVRRSPAPEGEPAFYQETRIQTRDAFRFSLMFAKRIHFATFRFGILESTGGLGTDVHLLNDSLELTADLFAFGEQAYPRLRARAAFEVVERLHILAGIDDALNASSDFFLGAMLRFNDEDLKAILPFAGGIAPTGG